MHIHTVVDYKKGEKTSQRRDPIYGPEWRHGVECFGSVKKKTLGQRLTYVAWLSQLFDVNSFPNGSESRERTVNNREDRNKMKLRKPDSKFIVPNHAYPLVLAHKENNVIRRVKLKRFQFTSLCKFLTASKSNCLATLWSQGPIYILKIESPTKAR